MAVRTCPKCMTVLSPAQVAAFSDSLECPGCKSPLTVWDGSRFLASLGGILAGVLVWQFTSARFNPGGYMAWTLPIIYALLAFGAVSAGLLMSSADLRLRPEEEAPAVALSHEPAHGAHGGHGAQGSQGGAAVH